MERLAVDDVDQHQADEASEREPHRKPQRACQRAFHGEHRADLAARHAEMAQHAEFAPAREHQGSEPDERPHTPMTSATASSA